MLLYCVISITCFMLGFFGLMALDLFKFGWLYVVTVLCFIVFFFTFFLLALENNNYNIKFYYSKKKFKILFNELISQYKIESKKSKRRIKRLVKDYFYQFGKIDVKNSGIETLIFDDWLGRHSMDVYLNGGAENKLDYFLYGLLAVTGLYGNYRINLNNLINIYNKDDIKELFDKCEYIKKPFKEKCMFMYDNPSFVSEEFLSNMYLELICIVEVFIGLISEDEFNSLMYNTAYYYSEDKTIAYTIEKDDDLYNVLVKDIQYGYEENIAEGLESEEIAIKIIEDRLKEYSNKS